ncbi:MAG: VWA domain-containing protein [Sedimentisphaerales bacterium]|nr:VWA domain-containing protein [Sedimentisphaerales bacterium]
MRFHLLANGDGSDCPEIRATVLVTDAVEQPRSKAVIVMTDGRDTKSPPGRSATEVISYAQGVGVPVFTIGLGSEVDEAILSTIAIQTGGMYHCAPDSNDLKEIYRKIAGALKNEYIVTYETAVCQGEDAGNPEHGLEIVVTDGSAHGQGAKRFRCAELCNQR